MDNICHCFLCLALAYGLGRESRGVPLDLRSLARQEHPSLLGIFSTNLFVRLEKSPNRLRYFPTRGNIRSCASIKSVVYCRTVCLVLCETMFPLFDCRKIAMDG